MARTSKMYDKTTITNGIVDIDINHTKYFSMLSDYFLALSSSITPSTIQNTITKTHGKTSSTMTISTNYSKILFDFIEFIIN